MVGVVKKDGNYWRKKKGKKPKKANPERSASCKRQSELALIKKTYRRNDI